ncbi:hypothetical protein [Superficieibacter electus]
MVGLLFAQLPMSLGAKNE